ncbi:2-nitropropane dioxygenase [Wolbachia endosymbiont of Drosophila mauritiana]|uniref:NAD(P)H-dependent flavin oxidoreductase n=1 Tax=unclassified Wolbachia TaxID=2640676 RepID=UPI00107E6C19|nr:MULTISPECIES: nitronate monooxygenase [unclassified Wolbachia]QCB62955.1 2-nitropropane dioxygenase [Wolbachia endosymbiont of Drosophila mauritiana]QCB64000.1 2-nitropropane dioxygenase [Wolbachia endosymbiont of Drosophila mauritiana]QWE33736.1 Enoyl-(Acyl-carrier-protein) reductase II [Wolbachia endosymbiont of Drosophila simulans]TGB06180.1 2-nitropropane dioxygenase [Wolbachia endosymbiont of Drosophila mauritiana]
MLSRLWKKGTNFLGSEFAIMGGAMSWVSERNLVSAISNAGGFGVIACGAMSPDLLKKEIIETQKLTHKPFGVNLITMHPNLSELIDICIETKVSHTVLAGGLPKKPNIEKIKNAGIKVMCFTPALSLAERLVKMGVDALIIEGMEAGGHIGPVSTSVLAQEILPHFKNEQIPVFVAGGIGRGEMIVNYLEMGASGCQIGTLFVCTNESIAHKNFKEVFIKSAARNAVSSVQISADFPVIPVRAIANKANDDFMKHQRNIIDKYQNGQISKENGQLEIEKFWAGALRRAVIDGDVETGSLMAGQSVGMVDREKPVKEVIDLLVQQASNYVEM